MTGDPYCSALVMKIASRCNINCSYCYMYSFEDQTYLQQPKFMSQDTVDILLLKVKEHCLRHSLQRFFFIFHGGEPLLAKKEFFSEFVEKARRTIDTGVKLFFSVQTNGILLTDEWCQLFIKYNIRVGVSLDGPQAVHDKHRVDHSGKGTFLKVLEGINTLKANGLEQTAKMLCVINVDTDPIEMYEFFKSTGIRSIDFLFPDLNYECLPQHINLATETRYADWLIKIFDRWILDSKSTSPIQIRRFVNAISLIMGKSTISDEMGSENNSVLVIETDGGIESIDSLKICGDGFTKENLNISTNSIDDALSSNLARLYYKSHNSLCDKCNACQVKEVCGGGHIVHRYKKSNSFDNPSIYCNDLGKIYTHIRNSVYEILKKYELVEA
ncbi:radical SAM protein [Chitinophaga flava]|uniref:Radical SAM core domain-containing protein n=1 Tax=Chitinophaga flava TaxID=2259036 RepID=A0A365XTE6_9BACT|nr:radical SAM protein [Chitinophaga flava]RBL89647.1 hypothetical protein DF182_24410 [Chitinophaga flava]